MSVLGAERSGGGGRAASDGERPRSAPPPIASAIGLKRVGEAQASPHLCPLLPCPPAGHLLICAYLCVFVLCCALLCFVVLCCALLCLFVLCFLPGTSSLSRRSGSRDDLRRRLLLLPQRYLHASRCYLHASRCPQPTGRDSAPDSQLYCHCYEGGRTAALLRGW